MRVEFRFPEGRTKVLTFSYDDGNRADARLADIFTSTGMKCTFNINGAWLGDGGKEGKLSAAELRDLLIANGHEVACHGKTHPFEEQLPGASMLEDVLEDRRILEAATGTIVRGMAYPFGTFDTNVINALKAAGIVYCRTTVDHPGINYFPASDTWLTWNPTCHHNNARLMEQGEALLTRPWGLQMLYVWGHAYEFDNAKNWNVIEAFCDKMKNRAELWYATNIEIHDYVEACRSLVTTCDAKRVYNPSALTVWIFANEKTYSVAPGETVCL